jgi:hypothetical protein
MRGHAGSDEHLQRLRKLCAAMPGSTEKLSHGEPTFFAGKRVFAMFSNNHHHDGHIAVWVPAPPGVQELLVSTRPQTYYRPPYVGGKGWLGIELAAIDDGELTDHVRTAWEMVAGGARSGRHRIGYTK